MENRGLSFRAEGGSMVGIVGRTGAGKSSIAAALFRLVELRAGCIRVDGIDVSSLALHTLRGRLAIVAQVCVSVCLCLCVCVCVRRSVVVGYVCMYTH